MTKLKLWRKKLKNSKCDKCQIVKILRTKVLTNTQIVIKIKNSNCVTNSNCDETQIVITFKNSNCDETEKLKWWEKKLKNPKCDHIQIVKKNSRTQIMTKLKKTQIATKLKIQIVTKLEYNKSPN